MKAKGLVRTDSGFKDAENTSEITHLEFNVPGPFPTRIIPVMLKGSRKGTGNWTWNGDLEKPTIKPSVLTTLELPNKKIVCHSFINDGKIQFLSDCTHSFAGQTLDLLDIEL